MQARPAIETSARAIQMQASIADSDARYALEIVKQICAQVGPGLAGSSQERERAALIKNELESHLGAGNVVVEEFTLAPGASLGALRISALFTLISALLYLSLERIPGLSPWVIASASLAFAILAVLPVLLETILYREFIDPLFKQKRSVNVIGRLRSPGNGKVKRLLLLSGHHDSALEFTWLRILGGILRRVRRNDRLDGAGENTWALFLGYVFLVLTVTMFLGCIAMLALSIIQMAGVITDNMELARSGPLEWVLLAYPITPAILLGMSYTRGGKGGGVVPGAADNLSASALVAAMCRFLVNNPACIPADTEIRFISFGSEEARLGGSRHYVERHLDELKRLDARLLNYEVVADPEISILSTDVAGVKHDPEMVKSVVAAAQRAGVPYRAKVNPTSGGGSDAGPFSQAGLKATSLLPMKMPHQMLAFYHQKWDSPEVLTIEPLMNVLKLTLEWVRCGGE